MRGSRASLASSSSCTGQFQTASVGAVLCPCPRATSRTLPTPVYPWRKWGGVDGKGQSSANLTSVPICHQIVISPLKKSFSWQDGAGEGLGVSGKPQYELSSRPSCSAEPRSFSQKYHNSSPFPNSPGKRVWSPIR